MVFKTWVSSPSILELTRLRAVARFFAVLVLPLSIAGCSGQPSGQSVVSGDGGFEIPHAELDQAISAELANGIQEPPSIVLQRVVDQKLFADEAHREKLDRDLNVVQAIEAAKREILARAYAERLVKALPTPSDAQVSDFYTAHPELFSAREILSLDEISLRGEPSQIVALKAQFAAAGGKLDALQAILARRGFVAHIAHVQRAPEQVDMASALQFGRLKVGESFVYDTPKETHLSVVTDVQPSPLSLAQATPQIRAALTNQARRDLIDKEAARLKADANIKYAKGYAPDAPAAH
jgi:EpsD family peptidyl-prolyl cis-trans isomerase